MTPPIPRLADCPDLLAAALRTTLRPITPFDLRRRPFATLIADIDGENGWWGGFVQEVEEYSGVGIRMARWLYVVPVEPTREQVRRADYPVLIGRMAL